MSGDKIFFGPEYQNKIKKILEVGSDKLHLLVDFERTLTNPSAMGLWQAMFDTGLFPLEFKSKLDEYYIIYHPIELDHSITDKLKKEKMQEWWEKTFELMLQCGFSYQGLEKMIREQKDVVLRQGANELLKLCNQKNIPVIILSSHFGENIKLFLEHNKVLYPNVHIVSNFFKFDDNGKAVSLLFPQNIIHVANKDEGSLPSNLKEVIEARPNTILLGDTVEDVKMGAHSPNGVTLNVGFLDRNIEVNRDKYREVFDLVLEDNAGIDLMTGLIDQL